MTNEQVHDICKLLEKGYDYTSIISELEFDDTKLVRQTLVRIKNRLAWNKISDQYTFDSKRKITNKSEQEVLDNLDKIKSMISEGYTNIEILDILFPNCEKRNSRRQTISNIRNGKLYSDK